MGFPSMSQTVVLQRAHFSLNWSFIKLQNFEFEHISSSIKMNFFKFKLEFGYKFAEFWLEYFEYV